MTITLRIVLLKPPASIDFALQKGSGGKYKPIQIQRCDSTDLHFNFDIEIKGDGKKNDQPGLGGAFVQGPASNRFIYIDIGTYAGAWENNSATGKFLYDAGLQLSLFNNILNIYIPLLYSKVYRDYFNSTIVENRFWKNISFSIDIQNFRFSKFFNQREL